MALMVDTLNKDHSISDLLNPVEKIHTIMDEHRSKTEAN